MVWTGYTSIDGKYIWSDGSNIYYSDGTRQYKLNGTTWETMTWSGLTDFYGTEIWTDRNYTYYSNGRDQYKLKGTTWKKMTWVGLIDFYGSDVWSDGNNIYYSDNTGGQYQLIRGVECGKKNTALSNIKQKIYDDFNPVFSGDFAANSDHVDINLSSIDIVNYNYMFEYFSTIQGMSCKNASYNGSSHVYTIYFKSVAPSAGTFYVKAHKIS